MSDSISSRDVKQAGSAVSKRAYHAPEAIWIPVGATAVGVKNTIPDLPVQGGYEYGPGWSGS